CVWCRHLTQYRRHDSASNDPDRKRPAAQGRYGPDKPGIDRRIRPFWRRARDAENTPIPRSTISISTKRARDTLNSVTLLRPGSLEPKPATALKRCLDGRPCAEIDCSMGVQIRG